MKTLVAAYAALPPEAFDSKAEAAVYDGLEALGIAGVEQPFFGALHRHDEAILLGQLRPASLSVPERLAVVADGLNALKF